MKKILIIGSDGKVGHRIKDAFPDCIRLDKAGSPDILADLLQYPELPECDAIIMLAEENHGPGASFETHRNTLHMAEFVVLHSIATNTPIVFASSHWAQSHPLTAYGVIQRAIEQMVEEHGGTSLRMLWSNDAVAKEFVRAVNSLREVEHDFNTRAAATSKIKQWRANLANQRQRNR